MLEGLSHTCLFLGFGSLNALVMRFFSQFMSVRKDPCFSQVILIKQRIYVDQIVHEHRSPLNERIEKETAFLSVRNYCGDFSQGKFPFSQEE